MRGIRNFGSFVSLNHKSQTCGRWGVTKLINDNHQSWLDEIKEKQLEQY